MDDTELPFGPVGLMTAADYYNRAIARSGGTDVVMTAKQLNPRALGGVVEDVERGFSDRMRDLPWQTDTCLGDSFYNRARLTDRSYVTAESVLQLLADTVAKNGNLLLSVPQRSDGTIDNEEERILDEIALWMAANGEAILGSRPWRTFGEGPTRLVAGMKSEDGF